MLLSPRISITNLAGLCYRLGTALEAGIDARTVWAREAQRARGRARSRMAAVSAAINRGESFASAINATGGYFPELFRELSGVGETTGRLAEVYLQLFEHYEHQRQLRRQFLAAITWPMFQLTAAVGVIGLLIWLMGLINAANRTEFDPLGFGLWGNRGLAIYFGVVASAAGAVALLIFAVRRGVFWVRPIQRAALFLPVLGPALRTLALSRLAWVMHLTLNTEIDLRKSLGLSLRATRHAKFIGDIPTIEAAIGRGESIYEAFCCCNGYPHEFLDALAVSEQSGRMVEGMDVLARQYQQRARGAMAALISVAGFAIWALVAALIIFLIFRLAFFYLGMLKGAMQMR